MKCDKCGKNTGVHFHIAAGVVLCKDCNKLSGGTVSIDDVMKKILEARDENKKE